MPPRANSTHALAVMVWDHLRKYLDEHSQSFVQYFRATYGTPEAMAHLASDMETVLAHSTQPQPMEMNKRTLLVPPTLIRQTMHRSHDPRP